MRDKRIATGIYRTATGYRVFVRVHAGAGGLKTRRYDAAVKLAVMKAWQEDQRVDARRDVGPKPTAGTFAEDITRYLTLVAAMPTYAWRKRDLHVWREVFGDLPRSEITSAMVRAQLQQWRKEGPQRQYIPASKASGRQPEWRDVKKPLSASACNHRRTALLHFFTTLDGKDAKNPVRAVPEFKEPAPEPRARDLEFLDAAARRMQNLQDQARARVLLWTGARGNCELGAMKPQHVDLRGRICRVPTGKGGHRFRIVPLNDRGVEAWEFFFKVKAWGPFNKNYLRRSFQRGCRSEAIARNLPALPVRVYDLRHSIATELLKAGADLSDVQDMLGHTTSRMTRRYAPFQQQKLAAAAKLLDAQVPKAPAAKVTALSYQRRRKPQTQKRFLVG
jgi:integrase